MNFTGLPDYTTKDPARLRSELQRQNAAIVDALRQLERDSVPRPKPVFTTIDCNTRFGEAVMVNSDNGNVKVFLPQFTSDDEGRYVAVGRMTANNTITVRPIAPQLVGGASSDSVASVGLVFFWVIGGAWWRQY
jgi:hypothetical protein